MTKEIYYIPYVYDRTICDTEEEAKEIVMQIVLKNYDELKTVYRKEDYIFSPITITTTKPNYENSKLTTVKFKIGKYDNKGNIQWIKSFRRSYRNLFIDK